MLSESSRTWAAQQATNRHHYIESWWLGDLTDSWDCTNCIVLVGGKAPQGFSDTAQLHPIIERAHLANICWAPAVPCVIDHNATIGIARNAPHHPYFAGMRMLESHWSTSFQSFLDIILSYTCIVLLISWYFAWNQKRNRSMNSPPWATLLKKTDSPSPTDHQLLTVASVRGRPHPSPSEILISALHLRVYKQH